MARSRIAASSPTWMQLADLAGEADVVAARRILLAAAAPPPFLVEPIAPTSPFSSRGSLANSTSPWRPAASIERRGMWRESCLTHTSGLRSDSSFR
jgi:hypothetical protein